MAGSPPCRSLRDQARRDISALHTGGPGIALNDFEELARLGVATEHEAHGRSGLVDVGLIQVVPGSRAAGPARTVRAGQRDNLMVHAALSRVRAGEAHVLTMPEPEPVALLGELIAIQAQHLGIAAGFVDAAVCDVEQLAATGLPVWARWIRATVAATKVVGTIDEPVTVGGAVIARGDVAVLDADGTDVVPRARSAEILETARQRGPAEDESRAKYRSGALAYDLAGMRDKVGRTRPERGRL